METVIRSITEGGRKGLLSEAQRIFRAVKTLYDTIMLHTSHYIFVQIHRMYTTKNKL